jgi:hypothetical protein
MSTPAVISDNYAEARDEMLLLIRDESTTMHHSVNYLRDQTRNGLAGFNEYFDAHAFLIGMLQKAGGENVNRLALLDHYTALHKNCCDVFEQSTRTIPPNPVENDRDLGYDHRYVLNSIRDIREETAVANQKLSEFNTIFAAHIAQERSSTSSNATIYFRNYGKTGWCRTKRRAYARIWQCN